MSHVIHPVGPQPPSVYWVRRVLVAIVVVLIIGGAVWLIGGRSGGTAPVASPSVSASPTPSASKQSATPTPSATPTKQESAAPSKTPTSTPTATTPKCKDSDISVTASTDAATYPVGSTPKLRMQITNTSSHACVRDVGALPNTLIINKGGTKFWSSDDCSPGGAAGPATIAAGQSYSVSVTWPGRASAQGCPANQPAASAGSYTLIGRNGNVSSAPAPFSLT
ncbi:MAG TPA: hypothetical protein VIC82_11800 [Candidatus Nanopelagicales bacterium]